MNDKSRFVLRSVASLYIMYIGFQLVSDVIKEKPSNFALLVAAGVFFLIAGGGILFMSLRSMRNLSKPITKEDSVEVYEEQEEEIVENERIEIRRAGLKKEQPIENEIEKEDTVISGEATISELEEK